MSSAAGIAGLYGKLPSCRDFLRRGLPNRFVIAWDRWLAHVVAAGQETLAEDWMHAYLTSPPWRFVLDPQVLDEHGWFGVVVSSVDTLHRCFPLTLAAASSANFGDLLAVVDCDAVMAKIEELALGLIDGSTEVDEAAACLCLMTKEIQSIGSATPSSGALLAGGERWATAHDIVQAGADDDRGRAAFSYWWHENWPAHPAIALRCRGLPQVAAAAGFFDSAWRDRGLIEPQHKGLS